MKTSHTEQQDNKQQQEGLRFLHSHHENAFSKAFQPILYTSSVTLSEKPTNLLRGFLPAGHKEYTVRSQGKQLHL